MFSISSNWYIRGRNNAFASDTPVAMDTPNDKRLFSIIIVDAALTIPDVSQI
jgi:hypothetical protein